MDNLEQHKGESSHVLQLMSEIDYVFFQLFFLQVKNRLH